MEQSGRLPGSSSTVRRVPPGASHMQVHETVCSRGGEKGVLQARRARSWEARPAGLEPTQAGSFPCRARGGSASTEVRTEPGGERQPRRPPLPSRAHASSPHPRPPGFVHRLQLSPPPTPHSQGRDPTSNGLEGGMWAGWAHAPRRAPHKHVSRMEKAWQELPQDDAGGEEARAAAREDGRRIPGHPGTQACSCPGGERGMGRDLTDCLEAPSIQA